MPAPTFAGIPPGHRRSTTQFAAGYGLSSIIPCRVPNFEMELWFVKTPLSIIIRPMKTKERIRNRVLKRKGYV
jgi:hypothetical protein